MLRGFSLLLLTFFVFGIQYYTISIPFLAKVSFSLVAIVLGYYVINPRVTSQKLAQEHFQDLNSPASYGEHSVEMSQEKQAEASQRKSEERLRLALSAAHMGTWDWNIPTNEVVCSDQYARVFGWSSGTCHSTYEAFLNSVHPEDREVVAQAVTRSIEEGADYRIEFRVIWPDGTLHWVGNKGQVYFDASGAAVRMVGVAMDITLHKQAEKALEQTNEKLTNWIQELEQHNREIALLNQMSDILQACLTPEEAYSVLPKLVQPIFPDLSGGIFLLNAFQDWVEFVATWGSVPLSSKEIFTSHECWALRRGRAHWVDDSHCGLVCNHVHQEPFPIETLCVPMMAQGKAIGLLYLSCEKLGRITQTRQQLAVAVAEQIALSLANLKLRETLENQSISDSLTGLFNRRYMKEALEREIQRVERKQQCLGIIMIDIDYFKRFNDTFGHDIGDAVLKKLAQLLQQHIRRSDIVCRYGGEEFVLILPDAPLEVVQQRAEELREGAKHLQMQHRRHSIGSITLSAGIAYFPKHGLTGEALLRAADTALYSAKIQGRDRVITYQGEPINRLTSTTQESSPL